MRSSVVWLRTSPLFAAAGVLCWGLAALLWYFPKVAAILVAGVLGAAGLVFFALGAMVRRAEKTLRNAAAEGRPAGPNALRDADATWREPPQK